MQGFDTNGRLQFEKGKRIRVASVKSLQDTTTITNNRLLRILMLGATPAIDICRK
jgi:hypothetical protein